MSSFRLWLACGPVEFRAETMVQLGDSHVYTKEGNKHLLPAVRCCADAEQYCDSVLSLGEHAHSVLMHPQEFEAFRASVLFLVPSLDVKPKKCECGSAKAKLPFHSSWCPLSS